MKRLRRWFCCLLLWCGIFVQKAFSLERNSVAANVYSWDFSDCSIRDILYVVSLDTGISIVADDTVRGQADFRFTGKDFERAFHSIL